MIPENIDKKIENAFIGELDEKYHLVYVQHDYSFENSPETVQKCLDNHDPSWLYDKVGGWIYESQYEASNYLIKKLKEKLLNDNKYADIHLFIKDWIDDVDNFEYLRHCIIESDHSEPVKKMIEKTCLRARVTQYTNHDCLPSNWDMDNTYYYQDYIKDIIDNLYLNPAKVKQSFMKYGIKAAGKWTNLAYRNGKEAVEYDAFSKEVLNQCCYCQFVFMGMFPLESMYMNGFKQYNKIVIPKGNSCGFFNSWHGGGSMLGIDLKRDLELPLKLRGKTKWDGFDLYVDERGCHSGYCIDEVYGMSKQAWGKEFKLIYN